MSEEPLAENFDVAPFIREAKRVLTADTDVSLSFAVIRDEMQRKVERIQERHQRAQPVIPELGFDDIRDGSVTDADRAAIRDHGCVIIRGVFDRNQAEDWNNEFAAYLTDNNYTERARATAGLDSYFGDLKEAQPQIFGVYWSRPQVLIRQAESMAATKRFLNGLWDSRSPTGAEFNPDLDYTYADRARRRHPGDTSLGLSPHTDAGSYERWVDPAYQRIYANVFNGQLDRFDPWKGAFRTQTRQFASPAVSSMFRTFQGWTALTEQGPGDGTLELLPIANAMAYILLRALQSDVPESELCLARPGRALGVDPDWHPDIHPAIVPIQTVQPGDTVWWHPDVVHAVAQEHRGQDHASVIYVGASPACAKNHVYALRQAEHFKTGKSAPDFAAEDLEVDFVGRATIEDLTALGRRQMAIS